MRHRAQPHVAAHPLVADDGDRAGVERALKIFEPRRMVQVRLRHPARLCRQHDSSIEDCEPVLVRDDRIEIHLGDVGMGRCDSRDGFEQ